MIRFADFERRSGDVKQACNIISEAMNSGQLDSAAPYLAMYLARFQEKLLGDVEAARTTYNEAIAKHAQNKNLWLAAINFEASRVVNAQMDDGEGI